MKNKRINSGIRIIIIAAVCVAAYIIVFHVPGTVMRASETIPVYSETHEVIDEEGDQISSTEYGFEQTVVKDKDGNFIGLINKEDLALILKSTKSHRELNAPQYYYREDVIYEINITTSKGPLHIIIGNEKSFWYRNGAGAFRNVILDSQTLYKRITEKLLSDKQEPLALIIDDYIFDGETYFEKDGRTFFLEDIPVNTAEESVVKYFYYTISGEFDRKYSVMADSEDTFNSIESEKHNFEEGFYCQSYAIHSVTTLTEDEYDKEKTDSGDNNKFNFIYYAVINVDFTMIYSETAWGMQYGDGTYSRNFLVGITPDDMEWKIYDFGEMTFL